MPFTPFHLGPGLLVKAVAPTRVSLTSFAATQVVIDVETLYFLLRSEWPVHRAFHSVVGGTFVGIVVAAAMIAARPIIKRVGRLLVGESAIERPEVTSEWSGVGAVAGGLIGGSSHAVLDAIMHFDVRPLWPMSSANGLLDVVGRGVLHAACILAGAAGVLLWVVGARRRLVV